MPQDESQHTLPERIYSPESQILSPVVFVVAVHRDLLASRELAWRLFWRDLQQRYRQSLFGVLWALAPPLVATAVFVFLNEKKILNIATTDIPYPIYVLLGTALWQVFAESVTMPLKMFESCTPIMIKINMPREAPVLAGMGQVLFYMGLQLLVAAAALVWFDVTLTWGLLGVLPGLLVLIALGTAFGLLLVPLGALFKDVGEGIGYLLNIGFFLTPVVYPPPETWPYSLLVQLNPVTPLLLGLRDLMTKGAMDDPAAFLLVGLFSLIGFLLALVFYRLSVPIVLERLGS